MGLALLLGVGPFLLLLREKPVRPVPPGFTVTTYSNLQAPTNLRERIFSLWYQYMLHRQRNSPGAGTNYTFNASPTNRCSVHGLLNQCMEVTGNRYLIADGIAAGTVSFGHTNALNGVQWVAAFEAALEKGMPQRWDASSRTFLKENLVLVRYPEEKTVLVLPAAQAEILRKTYEEGK